MKLVLTAKSSIPRAQLVDLLTTMTDEPGTEIIVTSFKDEIIFEVPDNNEQTK